MSVALGFAIGGVIALLCLPVVGVVLGAPAFERSNYRGAVVPVGGGLVLILTVVLGDLALSGLDRWTDLAGPSRDVRWAFLFAVVGFGFLGLLDDLAGRESVSGYRGHLEALLRGELTSGTVKIIGGVVVALSSVTIATDGPLPQLLADGALVALTANVVNLFDRRPGRAIKVTSAMGVLLLAGTGFDPVLTAAALALGAGLVMLGPDLAERAMLGDTGSNPMGAALGLAAVVALPEPLRWVWLLASLVLNLASERTSFTEVIASRRPLRWMDELGRRRA